MRPRRKEHTMRVPVLRRLAAMGDVSRSHAAIRRARAALGWEPSTSLLDGVKAQAAWQLAVRPSRGVES